MSEINNEELNIETAEPAEAAETVDAATEAAEPAAETPAPKKKKYRINAVRMSIFVICFGLAIFSAVKLIGILREYKQGADTYNEVEEAAFIPPKHDASDDGDTS